MTTYSKLSPKQKADAIENTKRWRAENREKHNEQARLYQKEARAKNPELHRRRAKEYKDKNKEKVQARMSLWAKANRSRLNEQKRHQHYKDKYGITIEERDASMASQGGVCKCCGADTPGNKYGWVVDHCHRTNTIRGILCHRCNVALGNVKDDRAHLIKLVLYLDNNNAKN